MLILVGLLFNKVSEWEESRTRLKFQNQADHLAHALDVSFNGYLQKVRSIERFYAASTHVDRNEFHLFTRIALGEFPGIQALEWIPRVADAKRLKFESEAQKDGFSRFSFKERHDDGSMTPAQRRDEYFPVFYVEPLAGNAKALGFDLASSPARKAAMDKARDSGEMVATARIPLVQEKQSQYGFLVFYPIYEKGQQPDNLTLRRQELKGFALGVFRIGDMVNSALANLDKTNLQIRLLDHSAPVESQELFNLTGGFTAFAGLQLEVPLDMTGRQWVLIFAANREYAALHSTGYPWMVLAAGVVITALFGLFLMTLTERTSHIEELVRQRTAQLKDSESRMNAIFATAVEAIITIDEFGTIETVNIAATKLFGYSEEEMVAQNVKMLMPSPHREKHDMYLERYKQTGVAKIIGKAREVEGQRKDGSTVPLELSVSDVKLAGRKIFTGILHDLTERKKSDRLKNEFVSTVSHELRTPLTSIQGSLGLIRGGAVGELTDKMANLIEVAHRNSTRLVRLINDILDLEKIEAGKMEFQLQRQELSPLVHQALETNQAYADKHGVKLFIKEDLPGAEASVDSDRFAQIMANLISNAVKFSPSSGTVEISLTRDDGLLKIAVKDHGQGIPASFRERIFSKFSQADGSDTRKTGGTGLGLAICQVILDNMGGRIEFETETGVGTTFYFYLPELSQV